MFFFGQLVLRSKHSVMDRPHSEKYQFLCVRKYKALGGQRSGASARGFRCFSFRVKHRSRRVSNDPTPDPVSEFKGAEIWTPQSIHCPKSGGAVDTAKLNSPSPWFTKNALGRNQGCLKPTYFGTKDFRGKGRMKMTLSQSQPQATNIDNAGSGQDTLQPSITFKNWVRSLSFFLAASSSANNFC